MYIYVEVFCFIIVLDVGMFFVDLDFIESYNIIGFFIKLVFRVGVFVVEDDGWEMGNWVVGVGEVVFVISFSSDEFGKCIVFYVGRVKGDEINGDFEVFVDVGSGDGVDGGVEGVIGDGDFEGWVGLFGGGDCGYGMVFDFGLGGEEVGVDEVVKGVVVRDLDKDEVVWVLDDLMLVYRDKWIRCILLFSF